MDTLAAAAARGVSESSPARPLLRVILGNLVREPDNEKFRKIRLDGKAGLKLRTDESALTCLTMCGFREVEIDGVAYFTTVALEGKCISAAANTFASAQTTVPHDTTNREFNMDGTPKARNVTMTDEPLSLKQQARRDATSKKNSDGVLAKKRQRAASLRQIAQDNHVRKNDANWKTTEGVQKGGRDIRTFRGKYGEEGGGDAL